MVSIPLSYKIPGEMGIVFPTRMPFRNTFMVVPFHPNVMVNKLYWSLFTLDELELN